MLRTHGLYTCIILFWLYWYRQLRNIFYYQIYQELSFSHTRTYTEYIWQDINPANASVRKRKERESLSTDFPVLKNKKEGECGLSATHMKKKLET